MESSQVQNAALTPSDNRSENRNNNPKRDLSLTRSISELFGHKKRNHGSLSTDKKLREKILGVVTGRVLFDEPLAKYSTLRIGGPADCIVFPQTIDDLKAILQLADTEKIPVFILGGGSNLLIRDGGIRGFTVCLREGFQEVQRLTETVVKDEEWPADKSTENLVYFRVQCGASTTRLVRTMANDGLSGLEGLAGVVGTIGGAIWGNAGTKHGEMGAVVVSITAINRHGTVKTFKKSDLKFSYRNLDLDKSWIIIEAEIRLEKKIKEEVTQKVKSILDYRQETQPLNLPNCGSVFKNPPKTKSSETAGELIDRLGLKGVRLRGAQVSEKHGNWIVNLGDASAHDVLELIALIKDQVMEKTGIELETEIKIVGERVKA